MTGIHLPHDHGHAELDAELSSILLEDSEFGTIADFFKALSDPTRVKIFWLLCHYEECVINISELMKMTSPAVSHHLRILRDHGLVSSRRDGKEVYYKASDNEQCKLLHSMIEDAIAVTCPTEDK